MTPAHPIIRFRPPLRASERARHRRSGRVELHEQRLRRAERSPAMCRTRRVEPQIGRGSGSPRPCAPRSARGGNRGQKCRPPPDEVVVRAAVRVPAVRVRGNCLVAVRRRDHRAHHSALGDRRPRDLDVTRLPRARDEQHRRLPAQRLLAVDQGAIGDHLGQRIGMVQQRVQVQRAADPAERGLGARGSRTRRGEEADGRPRRR